MSDAVELHCECGATRMAPAGIRTMSCVQCGRELYPPLPPAVRRPGIAVLALAAFASQLAAASVLCLAVAWMAIHAAAPVEIIACGALSLLGVLASGKAYRGNTFSLLIAGVIDAAIAGGSFARSGALADLDRVQSVIEPTQLGLGIAVFATIAAAACALAIPQARRYVAWQHEQLDRAIRTRRL